MTVHLPSLRDVEFAEYEANYGQIMSVQTLYRTVNGPTFSTIASIETRKVLPSERSAARTRLYREAFNRLNAQVQAHLDVTLPVPNH